MFDVTLVDCAVDGLWGNWSGESQVSDRWLGVWDVAEVVVVTGGLVMSVRWFNRAPFTFMKKMDFGLGGCFATTYIDGSLMKFVTVDGDQSMMTITCTYGYFPLPKINNWFGNGRGISGSSIIRSRGRASKQGRGGGD